jgi:hypothetical protein
MSILKICRSTISWIAIFTFCACIPAFAQFTSSVQGTITDPSGAVVPGAAVTLTNTETNIIYRTTSNQAGVYRFLSLPLGNYTVTVEQKGFKESRVTTRVTPDEAAGVDVKLEILPAGASVTVSSSEAADLNPDETRMVDTLSTMQVESLPSQDNTVLNLMRLAPGTTGISEKQADGGPLEDASSNRNYVEADANGLTGQSNMYILDGVPVNSSIAYTGLANGNGGIMFTPDLLSVAEIGLQTTTFNVDYGATASMQVDTTTKSGTNKFHFAGDWLYTDKIMDALNWFVAAPLALHDQIYELAGGGPIIKNHTFFFGSYEYTGNYGGASQAQYWWTPQFQSLMETADANSLDVSKFMLPNPATRLTPLGSLNSDGTIANGASYFETGQQVFGNDCGTAASFNTPCGMAVTEKGSVALPTVLTAHQWSVRLDHYMHNNRDRIFGYFFSMSQLSNSEVPNPTWDGETPTSGHDLTVNYTHTFSPNLLNTASFAYTSFNFEYSNTPHSLNQETVPFITSINDSGSIDGFAEFTPFGTDEAQYYGRDAVMLTHGRHNFSFGVEASNNWATDFSYVFARPFINTFNSTEDFLNDKLDSQLDLSHFSAKTGGYLPSIGNGTVTRYGAYAEDNWQVTPRLTTNIGIRWDDFGNPAPYSNSLPWANGVFDSGSTLTQIAQTVAARSVSHAFSRPRDLNFSPRGGFAWTPFKNRPNTVLRGGIGLFDDISNLNNLAEGLTTDPPDGSLSYSFGYPQAILSYGTPGAPPPYGFVYPAVTPGVFNPDGSLQGSPSDLNVIDSNLPNGKTVIWNFAVQEQLPAHAVASLNYSASHSYNQQWGSDLNRPSGNFTCGDGTNPDINGCAGSTAPVNKLVNTDWNSISTTFGGMTANYNALIAMIRQTWHTLTWQTSYTFGHNLADPLTLQGASIELQYNPKAEYGNNQLDVRHRLTSYFNYEIPVSHNLNPVVRTLAGGWNLGGDVIAQTGNPFTVSYNTVDMSETGLTGSAGSFYSIPDYAGTKRSGWSKSQLLTGIFGTVPVAQNTATGVSYPAAGSLFPAPNCTSCIGNAGRNEFRNPSYVLWEQSVVKKIKLPEFWGESSTLSLRGEAFNVANRVNWAGISGTTVGVAGFGTVTSADQARTLQVGARFEF